MTRFLKWLTTIPDNQEDELFFVRIRTSASHFFDLLHDYKKLGHKWEIRGQNRVCLKCGREQYRFIRLNDNMMWKNVKKP